VATKGTVQRRRLRIELKRMRLEHGSTQRDLAEALDWSLSKVNRIEAGEVPISKSDLIALLAHFGIPQGPASDELLEMARLARLTSRWAAYKDVLNKDFITFLEYEEYCSEIYHYNLHLIPGLLQTEEYADAVLRIIFGRDEVRRKQLVEARMERQRVLEGDDAPQATFVVDEAVIRREIGGQRVMRHQLERLQEALEQPNISLRVVPFSAGLYPGRSSAFAILGFADPTEDDVLYLEEGPGGQATIREVKETVTSFKDDFQRLLDSSWTEAGIRQHLGIGSQPPGDRQP
jgi:transcriptional regulator with XRE-family HTH domain